MDATEQQFYQILEFYFHLPSRFITLEYIHQPQLDARVHRLVRMPSQLLQEFSHLNADGNEEVWTMLLSKYGNDVIHQDYRGMIQWGLSEINRSAVRGVIRTLYRCFRHDRYQRRGSTAPTTWNSNRENMEKIMIAHVKNDDIAWPTNKRLIKAFPNIAHDLVHADLCARWPGIDRSPVEEDDIYGDWLLRIYWPHINNDDNNNMNADHGHHASSVLPSYPMIVFTASLESRRKSIYEKHTEKDNLYDIRLWFRGTQRVYPEIFQNEKSAYLIKLLDHVDALAPDQLMQTDDKPTEWKKLLILLTDSRTTRQMNQNGQYPLHVLLQKGLPGPDILIRHNERAVSTICPVTGLYPIQQAALPKEYYNGSNIVAQMNLDPAFRDALHREQVSQIYSLLRTKPDLLTLTPSDKEKLGSKQFLVETKKIYLRGEELRKQFMEHRKQGKELRKQAMEIEQEQAELRKQAMEIEQKQAALEAKESELEQKSQEHANSRNCSYQCLED